MIVEKNLCVSDLCQLLALKNRVAKDVNWTIIEHWTDLGLGRYFRKISSLRIKRDVRIANRFVSFYLHPVYFRPSTMFREKLRGSRRRSFDLPQHGELCQKDGQTIRVSEKFYKIRIFSESPGKSKKKFDSRDLVTEKRVKEEEGRERLRN